MRIFIMGGGIGGLAAAHELIKQNENHDITIIERHENCGGQSRSKLKMGDFEEYGLHAIGDEYTQFRKILSEVPYYESKSDSDSESDSNSDKKTVENNLIYIKNFEYIHDEEHGITTDYDFVTQGNIFQKISCLYSLRQKVTFWDVILFLKIYFIALLVNFNIIEKHNEKWADVAKKFSEYPKKWLIGVSGIYIGMDAEKISSQIMYKLIGNRFGKSYKGFMSFNGAMDVKMFSPWVKYLQSKGVKFMFNTEIYKLRKSIENKCVLYIKVRPAGESANGVKMSADLYINALPIESIAKLTRFRKLRKLTNAARQVQNQVLFILEQPIAPKPPTLMIFPNSPWFLMVRVESTFWRSPTLAESGLKEVLSCGIALFDAVGLCGKTARECTREELAAECWNQIKNNNRIYLTDGRKLSELEEYEYKSKVWESFVFDGNCLTTFEPKLSNNVGCYKYQPQTVSEYKNLIHSTGYTKTKHLLFNMESAMQAGQQAALHVKNFGCLFY